MYVFKFNIVLEPVNLIKVIDILIKQFMLIRKE